MKDIHNYQLRLKNALRRLDDTSVSARNKEVIVRFYNDWSVQGLTKPRLAKLVDTMHSLSIVLRVDLETATVDDIKRLVRDLDDREDWTAWTKSTYKAILKKFYKWLKGNNEEYPPEVKWIKATIKHKDLPVIHLRNCLRPRKLSEPSLCATILETRHSLLFSSRVVAGSVSSGA